MSATGEKHDPGLGWHIENAHGEIVCQGTHSLRDERDFPLIVRTVNRAAISEVTRLDLIWEGVNAIGGVASSPIDEAINATVRQALAIIENLGGSDPLPKRAALMDEQRDGAK